MITYELAKQLKDAGFKQKKGKYLFLDEPLLVKENEPIDIEYLNKTYGSYVPSLSELIEACGDGFIKLERILNNNDIWWDCPTKLSEVLTPTIYKNPEEAVANLWLELNK